MKFEELAAVCSSRPTLDGIPVQIRIGDDLRNVDYAAVEFGPDGTPAKLVLTAGKYRDGHNHPTPDMATYYTHSNGAQVTEDSRCEWAAGCPRCRELESRR